METPFDFAFAKPQSDSRQFNLSVTAADTSVKFELACEVRLTWFSVEVQFSSPQRFDGLKFRADVAGNDYYKWYECLKVLTEVSAKGVSKGENSAV